MPEYLTPGVYVEEVSFRAPSIEGVGTSTTGFVGVTRSGPNNLTADPKLRAPQLLTSFGDFQNVYGGYEGLNLSGTSYPNYMAMAVKAFFDNGGSQLYVSRVYSPATGSGAASSDSSANVVVKARFPGSSGNQTVKVAVKAARTQNVGSLPAGSLLASAGNISSLANDVGTADNQITLAAPMLSGQPASVLVDSEVMTVTGMDASGTNMQVTRPSPASHAKGAAVMGQIGMLAKQSDTTKTLTITAAPPVTTTPAPTTTPAGPTTTTSTTTTTTTPAPATTPAPPVAKAPANGIPAVFQVDNERFFVVQVDATGTVATVDHQPASHKANAPVFPSLALFANGATGQFQSGGNQLPSQTPAGMYVLTAQVTANTASGMPAVYDGLGFDPAHPFYIGTVLADTPPRHIDALQNQISFAIAGSLTSTPATAAGNVFNAIFSNWAGPSAGSVQSYNLSGGSDGGEPQAGDYAAALDLLSTIEEIAIVGAPGSGAFDDSEDIINSLITHVSKQRAYRVAVLETPPNQLASDNEAVRAAIDSSYAAMFVPWLGTPNPLASAGSAASAEIFVPPTGFMAGIWARNDQQHGVAKAPANEVVLGVSRLERDISFAEQGILNPLGINCIRYFPNRGFRVWGARTTSSDTEFMYLNVRRYLIYLEHSVDNSTQWAVFENNGPALWSRVKEAIDSFLYNEWKSGNLLGDTASQAYFVRCDRTTMTQNDLDNGRMICLIGVAVLKPAEFVIFRIGQTTALGQS